MPWTYEHNPTRQIVEVVYEGNITERDLRESTSECIELEKQKGLNRFLVDATKMKQVSSLTDIYNLPTRQYLEEKADRKGRVAVLLPNDPTAKAAVEFYENVCRNRGWMVQAFSIRQKAVQWLTGSRSSTYPGADDGQTPQ